MRARVRVFVRACLGECVVVDTNATVHTIEIFLLRIMFFFFVFFCCCCFCWFVFHLFQTSRINFDSNLRRLVILKLIILEFSFLSAHEILVLFRSV